MQLSLYKIFRLLSITVVLFSFAFCNKKKIGGPKEEPANTFDKQALLINMADNVILPSYISFKSTLDSLITSYNAFRASGLASDFQIVKLKFNSVYLKYQRVDLFEFGPAENMIVRSNFNIFPTDSVQIKNNITAANYDLAAVNNFDAKGLPALDFLLYGNNQTETEVINSFTSSVNRKQYVSDLLSDLSSKINSVINSWNSYRGTFINSLGTDVGSSLGFLVNQINFEMDYLKNAKIGTPLGKKTLGVVAPDKCEAFYGGQSVKYALESLELIENAYLGRSYAGVNGLGFDDYLDHLKVQHNEVTLNGAIIAQFALAKTKLLALANPLSAQVVVNTAAVDAAYVELVKLLVLLKTDMPSSLGVIITYQDGDGD